MTSIDGKQIANMLYHAGVETILKLDIQNLVERYLGSLHQKWILTWEILECCPWIYCLQWQHGTC